MTAKLIYGSELINYTIDFSNRKTMGISVYPDGRVYVKAPLNSDLAKIKKKLKKRACWIIKQQKYFTSFEGKLPPRKFISGESHYYLGRQYLLKVILDQQNLVKYKGRSIEIYCTDKAKAKELLNQWYKEKAKSKFSEIAEPLIVRFQKYGVEPSSLYIQEMYTRWGSCTLKSKVILNTELIKAARPCIEYVIIHELCHLLYKDHTKDFYNLLDKEMPDWKIWKKKLEIYI